ncbi:hypothetical protein F5879DRAFT_994918 [Lentinula edodes]|nr:hypothetical protein F5879DRAFT_994918 [Lentinula edodes]
MFVFIHSHPIPSVFQIDAGLANRTALANPLIVSWALNCFPSPSLPRTARLSPTTPDHSNTSNPIGKFLDIEAAASDADSNGEYDTSVNEYEVDSVIVADEAGDGSPIEWSPSPSRGHVVESQGQSTDEMDVPQPAISPKKLAISVPDDLYSNRVRQGTPEENRVSFPKLYSPIELSDDDYPVLPPPSPKESKEPLKPFLLHSRLPDTPSKHMCHTIPASNSNAPMSPLPPSKLISIVVNGRTYYASDDPVFTDLVSSPSSSQRHDVGLQVDDDSFELCYPPEEPTIPTSAPTLSSALSADEYDDMDIDLPADFRSIRALRTPSPDLPSNPLEGWSPTPRSRPSGASPSPPRSLLSLPSRSMSGASTANTSPSKVSAMGSPSLKSKGKDHVRFHPFKQSIPNHSISSPPTAVTSPMKSASKSSAVGKRYCDDLIRHALSDRRLPPSTPSNNRAPSSPHHKSRNALIRDALGENDSSIYENSGSNLAVQEHEPEDVAPFVDNNLGDSGVLNPGWIDRHFALSFRSIVNLPTVIIRPIADESITEDDDYLLYRDMVSGIPPSHEKCIRQVVNFIRCANVFNGARFDPTSPSAIACPTINNKIHLVLAEDHFFNAVFLTVGRVNESYIFNPKSFLAKDKAIRYIQGLRVHGLMQESQRLFACFGSLIGSTKFGCPVSEGIIDFRSNQRFDSDVWKDDPDNLSPLEPVTPGKKREVSNIPKNIHCKDPLPFCRAVAIFDGRGSFVASAAQLNQIASRTYPLYMDSNEELPPGSIVCVGYTAHTWQSSGSSKAPPLCLSLGLQFVVVLALPPGYDGPTLPNSNSSRPFPKPIYNTPTRTKDFPGPPRRKQSYSKASHSISGNVGHSRVP